MDYISGVATGSIGMLIFGFIGFLVTTGRIDKAQSNLVADLGEQLGQHLTPFVAALDRHGLTLQRHGRAVVGHGMILNDHAATITQEVVKAAPIVAEVIRDAAPVVEAAVDVARAV